MLNWSIAQSSFVMETKAINNVRMQKPTNPRSKAKMKYIINLPTPIACAPQEKNVSPRRLIKVLWMI